jgi:peptide/nickel transport system substrate-binding protein
MGSNRRTALAVGVVASLSLGLAGCGGGSDGGSGSGSGSSGKGGGTLTYYVRSAYEHIDPQRAYLGVVMTNLSRTSLRGLVAFPISDDPETSTTPVPDMATDTGTSTAGGKVWSFTLKDGITWEDGKPVTCEDFKYGASRVFASDVLTGGPSYLQTYLDVPQKDGTPTYTGPYNSSPADQAAFDKAITCEGNKLTYKFNKPWPDFPLAIASLHMMDPYRKDKDQGNKSNYQIFSNGPYKLEGGQWKKESGGTFVRNDEYDPASDSTEIRKALPDKIVFKVGQTSEQITDLLVADSGPNKGAVTQQSIPSSKFSSVQSAEDRTVSVESPYVDYLVPNFKRMTNPKVREALLLATDVDGWVSAGGGPKSYKPATDIVNPAVKGYQADLFPGGSGDPAKAKALLDSAGVKTPYPINFTYPSTPTADAQARVVQEGWEKAGFKVTLQGVANQDTYYSNIAKPDQDSDVIWAGWGADWPSAITVTPPLFDSRVNLSKTDNRSDYGAYSSPEFNALVDQAQSASDLDKQTAILQKADQVLRKDVAYIPVDIPVFYMLHGSKVQNFTTSAASNGYPDLGPIDVSSDVK